MTLGLVLILTIICAFCRFIIFKKRDIRGVTALIPGYNKYKIGKLVGNKRLGIANGIAHVVFQLFFIFCFTYELWIIQNYATEIKIPANGITESAIQVNVPQSVANIAIGSKYVLIGLAVITMILWCMMMWKFTMQHKRNPWWIILWACIPVIPYIYFAYINDVVSIDGKRYKLQKVEVKNEKN